ncbi:MAG: hypothetical protein KAS86_00555, partial [Candidatus Omnitrophica bacterium]|nr:hypothetical protein [Candidatus Omnitrophota bacterium]
DGIIPPEATGDADLAAFTRSVMDTVGSTMDASGKPGISGKEINEFFREAESYLDWKAKGEHPGGGETAEVMPWGAETPRAYQLVAGLGEKIEQYFTQCEIVAFDERARDEMRFSQKELEETDFTDQQAMEARLKDAPLAAPGPEGILSLDGKSNPLYTERLLELREKVVKRVLGGSAGQLSKGEWERVKNIFAPHRRWLEARQGAKVEKLGADILRSYLDGSYNERLNGLIAKDLARADDLEQIHDLEKLILYQKWFMKLANNFVSFADLYDPKQRALFEKGTLVIGGREITFTMEIHDRQAHRIVADKSYMYLLYLEVTGREAEDIKFEIMAPVTSGTADGLRIGKRGIFFTTDGREWDAEIVDITANPVSIWESVKAPFGQFAGFIKTQIDKFGSSGQGGLETALSRPSASGITRDLLLGGSIAIAALGTAFAFIVKALSQVKPVHVLAALGGIIIIVLLPGIIMGVTRIRKRDLSVLLEASGWAVNVRMRLGSALGRLFTHTPRLPKGARRERRDTVTQFVRGFGYSSFWSKNLRLVILIILLILAGFAAVLFTCPALKPYLGALSAKA